MKRTEAAASSSLHRELVAAIHGAFEVAVEIAVREVSKLVGQATGDLHEEMRRENESLKQRLERAEALLDSARTASSPPAAAAPRGPQGTTQHQDPHTLQKLPLKGLDNGGGVGSDTPPADRPPDPQHEGPGGFGEQGSGGDAGADPKEPHGVISEGRSPVCVVKVESVSQTCRDLAPADPDLPLLPCRDAGSDVQQVTVKQERPEEEMEDPVFFLDSIKVEDFSSECMSAVQSKMLEEWKPEALDELSRDSNSPLSCTGPAQAHVPDLTSSLPPPTDLLPLSSEFPNIFQPTEPAPSLEAPPKVYGVQIRSSRHLSHTSTNVYTCKSCGQTFHLPSLLRRHHGQCQQRLQPWCQQPVGGNKRTRLQLYPPGCSPFRCPECDREFNRMENLKTHLRIHTGERPYTCSVCAKCFRHSGALTRHFRIHTGEKPYVCGQCGKSFRNCGGLKFHQRSHSKQLQ